MSEISYPSIRRALNQTLAAIRHRPQTRKFHASPSAFSRPAPRRKSPSLHLSSLPPRPIPTSSLPLRSFSTSPLNHDITILQNPRVDDDGKEMRIDISERAAQRLAQISSTPPSSPTLANPARSAIPQKSHLRITVTSGGCHGFQYLMSLEARSAISVEEDTVFAFSPPSAADLSKVNRGETVPADDAGAQVVMDETSLELLKGSTVDYTTELIGSQFKIVGNPRASSSCGCGTSFDIQD